MLYVELFGCCGEREQQRPQSLCVCVFTLSTTARTVHRSSFSFFGEETLYYRGYVQKYELHALLNNGCPHKIHSEGLRNIENRFNIYALGTK